MPTRFAPSSEASVPSTPLKEQAQAFASLLMALAKEVIVSDDATTTVPMQQYRILHILHESGSRPMSEISREMGASLSSMTQMADRLERVGLVQRAPISGDRRVRSLMLTPHGAALMRKREARRLKRARTILQRLSSAERKRVLRSLGITLDACSLHAYGKPSLNNSHHNGRHPLKTSE